jgi:nucleoside-diphosphate-sugar epimerase
MKKNQIIGGSGFIGTSLIGKLDGNYEVNNIDKAISKGFPSVTTVTESFV